VAELYVSFGAPTFAALTRLVAGESLIAAGQQRDGAAQLERAVEFFRSVDAVVFARRGEALLAEAYSDSA
jgi:hypothetical protein